MVEEVQTAFEKLQATFRTGKTKTLEWRKKMLKQFMVGMDEMGEEFATAVQEDLGRDPLVTRTYECIFMIENAVHDLKHVEEYMADVPEKTEIAFMPGETVIRHEPLGVCAVIGAWNFPVSTCLKPVIQAITAGNCVLVKPSEVSANSSTAIKKFCDKYLTEEGEEAIICVEGGIDVGIAVNSLNLDLICFTGSTPVGKIIAQTAAKNLTPCILELGGKCPMIVDADSNLEFAIKKCALTKQIGCA